MEQLPLTFVQSVVEPEIQEVFTPAFNFTKINSSNGRLAFTTGKIYWLPDNPMAMLDQGWVINVSEIESCGKYGLAGFAIKLKSGKELRFSNVNQKMRDEITEAIEDHKNDVPAEEPQAAEAAPAPDKVAEGAAAAEPELDGTGEGKLMPLLAYLGVLVVIPLIAAKDSKYVRFHVNQGLILLILEVVSYVLGRIDGLAAIAYILDIAIFVFFIMGIINVFKGKAKELPLIGKVRIIS